MSTPPNDPSDTPWPPPPAAPGQPPPAYCRAPQSDNTLGGLIPTRNSSALIAYYLGVFSIIPCLGIVLGIAGFVLGLKGLAFAKQHPEAKGATHAWVGIIAGGLFGFGYLIALIVLVVVAALDRSR